MAFKQYLSLIFILSALVALSGVSAISIPREVADTTASKTEATPTTPNRYYDSILDLWIEDNASADDDATSTLTSRGESKVKAARWISGAKEASEFTWKRGGEGLNGPAKRQSGPSVLPRVAAIIQIFAGGEPVGFLGKAEMKSVGIANSSGRYYYGPTDQANALTVTIMPGYTGVQEIGTPGQPYSYIGLETGNLGSSGSLYANKLDYVIFSNSEEVPYGPRKQVSGARSSEGKFYQTISFRISANGDITGAYVNDDGTTLENQQFLISDNGALLLNGNPSLLSTTGDVVTLKALIL